MVKLTELNHNNELFIIINKYLLIRNSNLEKKVKNGNCLKFSYLMNHNIIIKKIHMKILFP